MDTIPSWLRPGTPESRLPVLAALLVGIALQTVIADDYTLIPRWPLITLELLLIAVLVGLNPVRFDRSTLLGRYAGRVLLAAITLDNVICAVDLGKHILAGDVSNDAAMLLTTGASIIITNVVVFGIWYWELDRGGPFARLAGDQPYPDFLFPQMDNPQIAPPDWRPTFVDYLYISVTNVLSFSPADTAPLARWAKILMTVQSSIALSTAGLVIARAVNVLR
ncbi:hypothetical protein [Mycolicibacterium sp. F2034L]|uniref:hypothetical protein n=1 Tax=Mycolicibacterium sp. F2034L TaxID=2926422 RepID=UPI001FF4CF6F|nr:hypothetical protein [Mycolicibacterium sp. F2034L]MCK0175152.1 hypothetical protein [Mycolicibacterium sp. F2034L]